MATLAVTREAPALTIGTWLDVTSTSYPAYFRLQNLISTKSDNVVPCICKWGMWECTMTQGSFRFSAYTSLISLALMFFLVARLLGTAMKPNGSPVLLIRFAGMLVTLIYQLYDVVDW